MAALLAAPYHSHGNSSAAAHQTPRAAEEEEQGREAEKEAAV